MNQHNHNELKQLLQKEVGCVNQLLESLQQEFEALSENQSDALEEVVRKKQDRIFQLELISTQRERIYSTQVIGNKNAEANHNSFGGDLQLRELWNELVTIAEKCREKNRVNGSIVDLVAKQTRQALNILHGILPGQTSDEELYDNAGQTSSHIKKHTLVQV